MLTWGGRSLGGWRNRESGEAINKAKGAGSQTTIRCYLVKMPRCWSCWALESAAAMVRCWC